MRTATGIRSGTNAMRRLLAACALIAGCTAFAPQAPAQECSVPPGLHDYQPPLPRTGAALAAGEPVTIVAIGGASTRGLAAGAADRAWPARMARALGALYPAADITVVNASTPREPAARIVERFDSDVLAHNPSLVIWETGTTDAVRGEELAAFRETVAYGIESLRAGGAEVILMDMQYSRRSYLLVNLSRYATTLRGIADIENVPLFPRFELMRNWSEEGVFNYTLRDKDARRELATRLYDCIGRAVADFIARPPGGTGTGSETPPQ